MIINNQELPLISITSLRLIANFLGFRVVSPRSAGTSFTSYQAITPRQIEKTPERLAVYVKAVCIWRERSDAHSIH